jgi:hypothetical protein
MELDEDIYFIKKKTKWYMHNCIWHICMTFMASKYRHTIHFKSIWRNIVLHFIHNKNT